MRTMLRFDLLVLKKSLARNVILWALLATGTCLVAGNAPLIILLVGFPMSHMVLMPMLLRDQNRDWIAFRQALPLSRADVVAGRYASIALVATGCVALGTLSYAVACVLNAVVPGLPLMGHFTAGFNASEAAAVSGGTLALTLAMYAAVLPFMLAGTYRRAVTYIPAAFMLAVLAWLYQLRTVDLDAFLPIIGAITTAAQSIGGALAVAGLFVGAACALYVASERAAARAYRMRDL